MASDKQMPKYRTKVRFADGRMQTVPMRDGTTKEDERRELFVVWENDGGRHSVTFAPEVDAAVRKVIGAKSGDKLYFDMYDNRSPAKDKATRKPAEAEAGDESEDDFDF